MVALALLAALACEAVVFAQFQRWVATGYERGDPYVPAGAFVAAMAAGYGVARGLASLELRRRAQLGITAAVAWVVLYGALRVVFAGDLALWDLSWVADFLADADETSRRGGHAFFGALLLLGAWVRASYRGSREVDLEAFPRQLAPAFVAATIVPVAGAGSGAADAIAWHGLAAYALGAAALAFSQLARSGTTFGELRAGSVTGVLLVSVAAAVLALVLLFGIAYRQVADAAGDAIIDATAWAVVVLLTPVAWVLEHVLSWLLPDEWEPVSLTEAPVRFLEGEGTRGEDSSPAVVRGLSAAGRALLLLAVLGAFALAALAAVRAWRRPSPGAAAGVEVERAGGLGEGLGGALRRWWRRGGAAARPAGGPATRIYLEMLAEAAERGRPRPSWATPEEFRPILREALATPLTDEATEAFEEERYGGRPAPAERVSRLAAGWQRVRSLGRGRRT